MLGSRTSSVYFPMMRLAENIKCEGYAIFCLHKAPVHSYVW